MATRQKLEDFWAGKAMLVEDANEVLEAEKTAFNNSATIANDSIRKLESEDKDLIEKWLAAQNGQDLLK
jgi:uncharacterized protein YggL (DUF469 family)